MDYSKTLCEQLNFSTSQQEASQHAIVFDSNTELYAAYDNLCKYCSENNFDLSKIDDADFKSAADILHDQINYRQEDEKVYFWIA